FVTSGGLGTMGFGLPAAIGAQMAFPDRTVIDIAGDGSIQMNIQELQTIIHNKIPLKLFVLNNEGYISIRNTQRGFFNGNFVGSGRDSGVSCPDTLKIAAAYGFHGVRISNQANLKEQLQSVLQCSGSVICEIMLDAEEKMEPKLSSEKKPDGRMVSKPLEDMYPFLDRDEFFSHLLIQPWDEDEKKERQKAKL
ncbi:MAG: thiamine pyrophosphate-dependent enzyme, partial [Chlorobium sp.]